MIQPKPAHQESRHNHLNNKEQYYAIFFLPVVYSFFVCSPCVC